MGLFNWNKPDTALDETRRNQAAAADPTVLGLGQRQRRHRQDARADHARAAPAAGRYAAGAHPGADLHQGGGGRDVEARVRALGRLGDGAATPSCKAKLEELLGRAPSWDEMQRARQLFAIAIETPGGLKVQTIHAFCERLLQRFPLEAGVAPGFAILDDQERNALLREAIDEVLTEATSKREVADRQGAAIGGRLRHRGRFRPAAGRGACASATG